MRRNRVRIHHGSRRIRGRRTTGNAVDGFRSSLKNVETENVEEEIERVYGIQPNREENFTRFTQIKHHRGTMDARSTPNASVERILCGAREDLHAI